MGKWNTENNADYGKENNDKKLCLILIRQAKENPSGQAPADKSYRNHNKFMLTPGHRRVKGRLILKPDAPFVGFRCLLALIHMVSNSILVSMPIHL